MIQAEIIKNKILKKVEKFYEHKWGNYHKNFIPGHCNVPYAGRVFDEKELLNLTNASLDFWLTEGKWTKEFEKKFSEFLNTKHTLLVNSGSSANLLAFMALTSHQLGDRRIKKGDEVITVACTFPTTIAPIIQYGAVPVFADVDYKTGNIIKEQIEELITKKTKAVMLAHTLGNPFDANYVKKICKKHKLWFIEDNCDALGAKWFDQYTGTWGDIGTSSFYPPHHITCLPYEENLYIKHDNKIKFIKIGEFVENFKLYQGAEAISFDKNGNLNYQKIQKVSCRDCNERVFKITTQTGRNVTVSETHKLFKLKENNIIEIQAKDLKQNDFIIIPRKIPNILNREKITFENYKKGNWKSFEDSIKINEDFAWFLGLFCAEGNLYKAEKSGNYNCVISLHKKEASWKEKCDKAISSWKSNFNIIYKKNSKAINLIVSNKSLFNFLQKYCNTGSYRKKVPDFIFSSDDNIKKHFLKGYFDGDGTIHEIKNKEHKGISVEAKTVSKELSLNLFYLLMSVGIQPRISKYKNCYVIGYSPKSIIDAKGFRGNRKNRRLFGDLSQVKISKIEEVKGIDKLYDISVPLYENFMAGTGMLVHNCGEGGAVYTNNDKLIKIMKSMRDWGRDCTCPTGEDNKCGKRFTRRWKKLPHGYDHKYVYSELGYNLKATDLQASILCAQLDKLPEFIKKRNKNHNIIFRLLVEYRGEFFNFADNDLAANTSWFGFLINVTTDKFTRNDIVKFLESKKIQTRMLFAGNITYHPCFNNLKDGKDYITPVLLTGTDNILNNSFWIGVYPGMLIEQLQYIADCFSEFLDKYIK